MFPQIAIAGPIWTILDRLQWLNTYQGLVAAYVALCLPLATGFSRRFPDVPGEIEEAALIDGCSRLQALYKIVLPLAAPGILTAALLVFIHAWNEFFFALIIMTDPNVQTLPGRYRAVSRRIYHALGRDRRGIDHRHDAVDLAHADFSTRHRARLVSGRGERLNRKPEELSLHFRSRNCQSDSVPTKFSPDISVRSRRRRILHPARPFGLRQIDDLAA